MFFFAYINNNSPWISIVLSVLSERALYQLAPGHNLKDTTQGLPALKWTTSLPLNEEQADG